MNPSPAGDNALAEEAIRTALVSPAQMRDALTEQSKNPRPLSDILLSRGYLTPEQLASLQGRYRVEEEIARGGMGVVLKAVDRDVRREVAMKLMLDDSSEEGRARFVEEGQVTGQLEHPNIVPVHEVSIDGQGRPFFTMKLVRGKSLAQILKGDGSEAGLGRLLGIFTGVCNAIAFAHSRGVVHRDLKPANIMVGDFGEVLVMDWGLAKVGAARGAVRSDPRAADERLEQLISSLRTDSAGSRTLEGAVMGTPQYMPPEQARGEIDRIDARSDIYSLGAILYEMLALRPPVKGRTIRELLQNVAEGRVEPLTPARPDRPVPAELAAVALKAMSRDSDARYADVAALRKDIDLYLEGRAVSAKPDSAWETLVKLVRRNRGASVATAISFLVLAAGAAAANWINLQERRRAEGSERKALENEARADRALADFRSEQERRAVLRKTAAPAVLEKARRSLDRRDVDAAMKDLEVAMVLDPGLADAVLLKAGTHLARKEIEAAAKCLADLLVREPGHEDARLLADLCVRARTRPDAADLGSAFSDVFARRGEHALAESLMRDVQKLLASYRSRVEAAWGKKAAAQLTVDPDGKIRWDMKGWGPTDLSPLRGIPIARLTLNDSKIDGLGPLEGMPIEELWAGGTSLKDLSPLKGAPLKVISLVNTQVRDLTPLQGAPLAFVDLPAGVSDLTGLQGAPIRGLTIQMGSSIRSLEPLRGAPLETLKISSGQISDLSPLLGMPLTWVEVINNPYSDLKPLSRSPIKRLNLYGCPVKDLGPLRGLPLEWLNLFRAPVADLGPLQGAPLRVLAIEGTAVDRLDALAGLPLEDLTIGTETYGAPVRDLSPLKGLPLKKLSISRTAVRDLAPLKGLSLESLSAAHTGVHDLSPLSGMPLKSLELSNSQVRDLAPLAGLPLTHLSLVETRVDSLGPLKGAPLESLRLEGSSVTDLTPLAGCKLRVLTFSPLNLKSPPDALRAMGSIQSIGIDTRRGKLWPPAEFWRRFDAKDWR